MNSNEDKKVRNNKLEYFLKKNMHPNIYNDIRWYEAVIFRTGNALAYKQAIVSGEDLYLTETPPRSLTHLLHSSDITQVQLVHDLPEFLRGGVRDQTTHVTLRYRESSHSNSLGKSKSRRHTTYRSVPLTKPSTSSIDEEGEDVDVEDGRRHLSVPGRHPPLRHLSPPGDLRHPLPLSLGGVQEDPSSPSSDPSSPSFRMVSMDALSTRSDESCSASRTKHWPLSPLLGRSSSNGILSSNHHHHHHEEEEGEDEDEDENTAAAAHRSLPPTTNHHHHPLLTSHFNGAKSPIRSSSPDIDKGTFDHRSLTPTIADLLSRVSGHNITRSMTPDGLSRSKMPRSVSALETYHRSSPLHLDLPSRSKSVLDKPSMPGQPPRRSQSLNLSDVTDGRDDVKEVHLYTLSTSTLLFHLLQSLWVASSLKKTLYEGKLRAFQHGFMQERNVDHEFGQLHTELLSAVTMEDQFATLQELQQGAEKYSAIRRLFWKESSMLHTIRTMLKQYSRSCNIGRRKSISEADLQERQDELEVLALSLETLATCLHGTQRCPLKMKALQQNGNECLRQLIHETMVVPEVPDVYKLTCGRWLTDFRELSSNAWENLPESELLRLVQEVTHSSVSCLYELLASANELSWIANPHSQSQELGPSLTTILQHAPVEAWLSYCVPQLLVFVQPERTTETNGSEACLLHQYCSVLNTILHHSPTALHYCTTHFAEELRFYVQESLVNCRLNKSCPIRPHTLKVVRTLSQLVVSKNALRSR